MVSAHTSSRGRATHAPCTSTTLRASTGAEGWAWASNPPNVAVSTLAAIAATIRNFVIDLTPWLNFLRLKVTRAMPATSSRIDPELRRITMLSGQCTAQVVLILFSRMKGIAVPHRGFSDYPGDLLSIGPDPSCCAPATE